MQLLISGLLLWSVIHFIPSIGRPFRTSFVHRFGEKPYLAIFSLLIISSLLLIIFGWQNTTPSFLYALPASTRSISIVLVLVAFLLLGAAKQQTAIKRVIRHPQLTGLVVWASAHLLVNGDSRSVVLFGWLGCWAILEMIFINKREGVWVKPEAPGWKQEVKATLISLIVFVIFMAAHPFIAGVPVR